MKVALERLKKQVKKRLFTEIKMQRLRLLYIHICVRCYWLPTIKSKKVECPLALSSSESETVQNNRNQHQLDKVKAVTASEDANVKLKL